MDFESNRDPLAIYDRNGKAVGPALRNLWRPSAAFYVCSGPSLNRYDLARLKDRGIVSLGVNNAAGHAPCTAFVCSDPVEKFHHGIFFDPRIMKFVPTPKLHKRVRAKVGGEFRWTAYNVSHCPNVWGFDRKCEWDASKFFHTTWATWGVNDAEVKAKQRPKCIFTFFIGLRLLHYLGVGRVYLLGVDFAMDPGPGRQVGNYAFAQAGAGPGNNDHYRAAAELLPELLPVFERHKFEVYNCNPDSRLTLFPHVPFDEALLDCRGAVPEEPFDLAGWYEKAGQDDDYRD